jgi:hypothetical protein
MRRLAREGAEKCDFFGKSKVVRYDYKSDI